MPHSISFSFSFLLASVLALPPGAQDSNARARQLFVANCASCHGETGDGKGTAQLDRPARSFKDGGFSFGNTPEALFRTISVGIPGSPMAGFDTALSEEDRKLLADYVITLGPPIEAVSDEDTILVVHDRPVIVRGLLPPLAEGLPSHPRGLLIGDPSGITFEYQVDDVRLLALRQGGFVKRTDWTGRGGTPLEPLGKVVHLVEGGKPAASFFSADEPLTARLSGTRAMPAGTAPGGDGPRWDARMALLDYHLVRNGSELAHATEFPHVATARFGTGYQRDIWLVAGSAAATIGFRTPAVASAQVVARGGDDALGRWLVVRSGADRPVFVALEGDSVREHGSGQLEASIALRPNQKNAVVSCVALVLTEWNDDLGNQIATWWEER